MAASLVELLSWFPSGTAEGEKAILENVFVYVDEFSKVMNPPAGNPHLLIGPKGIGKSAIIDFGLRLLSQQGVPALCLTPFDIDTSGIGDNFSTGDMTRLFMNNLMSSIATKLAETSTGWFDGDQAALYREAVDSGNRSPDFVGRMGKFIAEAAKPLTKIDVNAAFPHLAKITNSELEKVISRSLSGKTFYVFIDDTDQIAHPDKSGQLNRIWALILAVRRLCSTTQELKAIISLRSEVWDRLKIDGSGQRDQTDHFNSLQVRLRSDPDHVKEIVRRRLNLAAEKIKKPGALYGPFFEGEMAHAPYSKDLRKWSDLIAVRSRDRPRDAIQLINKMANRAIDDKKLKIDEATFQSIMSSFSDAIAADFSKEVALECPVALEILRTFGTVHFEAGAFTMTPEQTLNHFKMVISKFSVSLYGITLSQTNDRHIFELWRFFFQYGVVSARVSDPSRALGFSHLDPAADPILVSRPRWNDLQKTLWEVNTVYRDFLMHVGQESKFHTGLAVKGPSKPRRSGPKRGR